MLMLMLMLMRPAVRGVMVATLATIALALLALATLVVAALFGRTLFGIAKGELLILSIGRTAWVPP
jgi:hypothetical protein